VIKITPLNQLPTCTGVKYTWNAKIRNIRQNHCISETAQDRALVIVTTGR